MQASELMISSIPGPKYMSRLIRFSWINTPRCDPKSDPRNDHVYVIVSQFLISNMPFASLVMTWILKRLEFKSIPCSQTNGWLDIQSENSGWSVGWFYREFFTMSSSLYIISLLLWAPLYFARALRCSCESNWGIAFWYYHDNVTSGFLWAQECLEIDLR